MQSNENSVIIDATGLSCPEPLLKAHPYLVGDEATSLTIYVDNEASKENILRAGRKHGWNGEALEVTSAIIETMIEKLDRAKFQLSLTKG